MEAHTLERNSAGQIVYPVPLATNEACLADEPLFARLLQNHLSVLQAESDRRIKPSKYRVPTAAGQELPLHGFYREVAARGGMVAVTQANKWKEVVEALRISGKANLTSVRRAYATLLFHFEQSYLHRKAGQPLLELPEQPTKGSGAAGSGAGCETPGADGGGDASRPARSKRGAGLAALIAAGDSSADEGGADEGGGMEQDTPAAAEAPGAGSQQQQQQNGAQAAMANGTAAGAAAGGGGEHAAAQQRPPRSPAAQQQGGQRSVLAPARNPELTAFLQQGRPFKRDLTGHALTGKVDKRFDLGYLVSLTVGGCAFEGVLYCPGGGGGSGSRAAVKQEEPGPARKAASRPAAKRAPGAADAAAGGSKPKKQRPAAAKGDGTLAGQQQPEQPAGEPEQPPPQQPEQQQQQPEQQQQPAPASPTLPAPAAGAQPPSPSLLPDVQHEPAAEHVAEPQQPQQPVQAIAPSNATAVLEP